MDHEEFAQKMKKGMGNRVPPAARETYGQLLRSKGTKYFLNWDWIKDNRFVLWVTDHSELEFGDSENGFTVWVDK